MMNKQSLAVIAISLQLLFAPALANASGEVSEYTARHMHKAQKLADEDKNSQAIAVLKKLDLSRDTDKALVNRMLGILYWQIEKPKSSAKHLGLAVNSGFFVEKELWQLRRMYSSVLLVQESYSQALKQLYKLDKTKQYGSNLGEVWLYIAQAHYQLEQWKSVITALGKHHKYKSATINTLSMRITAENNLSRWKSVARTSKQLIRLEPKRKAWWQLGYAAYMQLDNHRKALDVLSLADISGIKLTQGELRSLASLYAQRGVYEKAAQTLARLSKSKTDKKLIKLQAQYWQMAKEWQESIDFWTLLAKTDPSYYWNVAVIQNQLQHYPDVVRTLKLAKNSKKRQDIELMRSRAFYKLNQFDHALASAKRADSMKANSRAQSWLKFLTQKRLQQGLDL